MRDGDTTVNPELPKANVRIGPSGLSLRYGPPDHGATSSNTRASA